MATNILEVVRPGERANFQGRAVANKILLAIANREFRAMRAQLEFVDLPARFGLHEPGEKMEFAYFPNSGMVSLVVVASDGRTVEVGVVGNEGMACLPGAVYLHRSPLREVVQIAGEGFRIHVRELQQLLQSFPQLNAQLTRYAVLHGMQVSQTAACNRLHDIRQRLARWLLMAQDRVDSGLLQITHDFLATMLGTDRPSVSLAAGFLQKQEAISYLRGAVQILNRKRLESFACECYSVMQQFNGCLGIK